MEAMRRAMEEADISGTIVIGEGERDEAPMLYIGEKVGTGSGPKIEIALDPLEGTTLCATGGQNALSVIAAAEEGGFLHAPDTYMEKIAVGPAAPYEPASMAATKSVRLSNGKSAPPHRPSRCA